MNRALVPGARSERLVKSKKRVADHGEVFTPTWLVNDMLDLVKDETERIDSRFLARIHRCRFEAGDFSGAVTSALSGHVGTSGP